MSKNANVQVDGAAQRIIMAAKDLALDMAEKSRAVLRSPEKYVICNYKNEDRRDIVMDLDVAIEGIDIPAIKEHFPEHNIISEESGDLGKRSRWTWYVDAVDGSKNALFGIPLFASSIALQYDDMIVVGVVATREDIYSAVRGEGAFLNGERIHVSNESDLSKTFIFTDTAKINALSDKEYEEVSRIQKILDRNTYRTRRLGCGSFELCRIAAGMPAAYLDITGKEPFYDVAAGLLLVEEAGGETSDRYGRKLTNNANYAVASNGRVHEAFLKMIN